MIPCYQLCSDRNCPHWNQELLDCEHLPDDCDYVLEHLVEDRENQKLDGEMHGKWIYYDKLIERNEEYVFIRGVASLDFGSCEGFGIVFIPSVKRR